MIHYRDEIKRMKRHRRRYFPVLRRMVLVHKNIHTDNLPLRFNDDADILVILELLDLGYLDRLAFPVRKAFGNIESIVYNGNEPLTESGRIVLDLDNGEVRKKKFLWYIGIALLMFSAVMIILLFII